MSTYEETVAVAAEISRAPGGYQTRTSAERPNLIEVKGGKMKGWEVMTVAVAKIHFGLVAERSGPTPEPEPEPAPPQAAPRAPARAVPQPAPPWVPRQGAR